MKLEDLKKHLISINKPFIIEGLRINLKDFNNLNLFIIEIDCNNCLTVQDLFNYFLKRFDFPNYFGHNWSALEDCLGDLCIRGKDYKKFQNGFVIIFKNSQNLFREEMNYENPKKTFREILDSVAEKYLDDYAYRDLNNNTKFGINLPCHFIFL